MTFWDKARQAAAAAAVTAKETAGVAGAGARGAAGIAKTSASAAVDKINPNTLADLIIKATTIQERTNWALQQKGSPYRVAEISITAAFPPEISFAIGRVGDIPDLQPWQPAQPAAGEWQQLPDGTWQPTAAPSEAIDQAQPAYPGEPAHPAEPGWGLAPQAAAAISAAVTPEQPQETTWPPAEGWQQATEGWEEVPAQPGQDENR